MYAVSSLGYPFYGRDFQTIVLERFIQARLAENVLSYQRNYGRHVQMLTDRFAASRREGYASFVPGGHHHERGGPWRAAASSSADLMEGLGIGPEWYTRVPEGFWSTKLFSGTKDIAAHVSKLGRKDPWRAESFNIVWGLDSRGPACHWRCWILMPTVVTLACNTSKGDGAVISLIWVPFTRLAHMAIPTALIYAF